MKKQLCALLLVAMLMSISACAAPAEGKNAGGGTTGFVDVEAGAWYAPYVEVCAKDGIMIGTSETTFSPNAPLGLDQLQVLLIRLYDRLHGGDGTIPPLPEDPMDYLQFLDADGNRVAGIMDVAKAYDWNGELRVEFATKPAADELTLQMAFPGDGMYLKTTGSYDPEAVQTLGEPNSALDLFQSLVPEGQRVWTTEPEHYAFSVDGEKPADAYAKTISIYRYAVEQKVFDDYWDLWYYPATYYLNYREGYFSEQSTPREQESPDLSPSDTAWREELALYLADYCPELVPWVDVPEEKLDERYTYSQNAAICGLYQAGILTGTDAGGSFDGQRPLTRAEAAAVIARVLRPELRSGQGILEN